MDALLGLFPMQIGADAFFPQTLKKIIYNKNSLMDKNHRK
jgi:hypothetical protein